MGGIGSALDFGIQTAAGTYIVIATNPGTGCSDTMTGASIIAVSPYPVVDTISGPSSVCQFASISLTDDSTGGTWSSADMTLAMVGSSSGVVSVRCSRYGGHFLYCDQWCRLCDDTNKINQRIGCAGCGPDIGIAQRMRGTHD